MAIKVTIAVKCAAIIIQKKAIANVAAIANKKNNFKIN